MAEAVLTIDVGTSRCKATLFDPTGRLLGQGSAGYPSNQPAIGWVEQDPADWWRATCTAVRAARAMAGAPAVAAVAVTGQMHGVVAVDSGGRPLAPCPTVRDRRAGAEVEVLERVFGLEAFYRITGARLDPAAPVAKLLWWSRHIPEVLAKAQWFLAPKDYLRLVLTGVAATEPVDAAGMLLYDLESGNWHSGLVEASGARPDQLPAILPCTAVAGRLQAEAAAALGLTAGISVIAGAGDDVEFLGAGLVTPGTALEHLGTTGSLLICAARKTADPALRLEVYPHAVPGLWLVGGSTSNAGGALDWAARVLNGGRPLSPPQPQQSGRSNLPLFLPYLSGERSPLWDPTAQGAFFGLELSHTHADLVEAVYLGVAFSLRHIADAAAQLGLDPGSIIVSGSGRQAVQWAQLRADVYGRRLRLLAADDATATGAMLLAAVATGQYPDLPAAVAAVVRERAQLSPSPGCEDRYGPLYAAYQELYLTTRGVTARLAESRGLLAGARRQERG